MLGADRAPKMLRLAADLTCRYAMRTTRHQTAPRCVFFRLRALCLHRRRFMAKMKRWPSQQPTQLRLRTGPNEGARRVLVAGHRVPAWLEPGSDRWLVPGDVRADIKMLPTAWVGHPAPCRCHRLLRHTQRALPAKVDQTHTSQRASGCFNATELRLSAPPLCMRPPMSTW